MKPKIGLSQDWLKLIACITMLIDHIGAILFPQTVLLRIIGRISFPIYSFLLVEGFHHTHNHQKYMMRLASSAIISEFIYDLTITGKITWQSQSIMITLVIGLLMLWTIRQCKNKWLKIIITIIFCICNEIIKGNYGIYGIGIIAMFAYTRDKKDKLIINSILTIMLNIFQPDIQIFALSAIPIIGLYNGEKIHQNKHIQTGFYLFYPLHLSILYIIKQIIM